MNRGTTAFFLSSKFDFNVCSTIRRRERIEPISIIKRWRIDRGWILEIEIILFFFSFWNKLLLSYRKILDTIFFSNQFYLVELFQLATPSSPWATSSVTLNPYSISRILFSIIASRDHLWNWFAANLPISLVSRPRGCGSREVSLWNVSSRNARQKVGWSFIRNGSGSNRIIDSRRVEGCYPSPLPYCVRGPFRRIVIALIFVPRSIYRWKQIGCPIIPLFVIGVQRFSTRHG